MEVNFFATFRMLAGTRQAEVFPPAGASAWDAMLAVLEAFPELRAHWLNEEGELFPHVHGFLNGQEIPTLPGGWQTPVSDRDVLDFLPPVAGGSRQAENLQEAL